LFDRASETSAHSRLKIIVYMRVWAEGDTTADDLATASRSHFSHRAHRLSKQISTLFKYGRRSLLVGLGVLAICLSVGQTMASVLPQSYFVRSIEEGLVIVGWVANWRPIEIFLYDWWPLAQERRTYRRLAASEFEFIVKAE
jgi:hypothetical protein